MSVLSIKGLHASVGDREILRGLDLDIGAGEVHAIMGPNGPGKSTLSYVLAGREGYEVTAGEGVAVRTGHHCAQPVMDRFDVAATVRRVREIFRL